MHNKPYVGRIALCTRKKLLKSGEIRHFYGIQACPATDFIRSYTVIRSTLNLTVTVTLICVL